MKVKELIERLSKEDPEKKVWMEATDDGPWEEVLGVQSDPRIGGHVCLTWTESPAI